MWHRVKDLWQYNRLALMAFGLVLCLAGFFGFKSVSQFLYWSDPAHQDQAVAGWMTPRYVAQSYRVPPQVIQNALDLAFDGPPRRISLDTLAAEQGLTMAAIQARVDTAVAAWRAQNPRPRQ
ncbi:hypothetical protein BC777_0944 [Yoonia maricola]|uniref:Uncharacterized protein n=1 Tax=Yoonia maricola TaxID=420999 RepID=A0A2M8WME9_9RHOB|nr:hypothetical protein [Yoonia maricola]PJI92100.1 hypothetical protein BC777_0944 [Yoonia maricola]